MVSAIIVAAGSSRRMGFDKLFAQLAGHPVIAHSIAAFQRTPGISEIIIVTRQDQIPTLRALATEHAFSKITQYLPGGPERHLSVWAGLQAVGQGITHIAIHDAARPLITPPVITQCIDLARKTNAACVAAPIPDTVKRADSNNIVTQSIDRTGLWAMQTPQIFSKSLIISAYEQIIASGDLVTDEVSAVQRTGAQIALLRNDESNFKITIPRDLALAEHLLASTGGMGSI
jgi:2-C-methyl-D-erythritol 4-phosphate cytidylyltransferase